MTHDSSHGSADGFTAHFGRAPRWMASAPGRVNLIGEFTDYNDGFVLPMALEFKTWVSAAPNDSDRIVVRSDAAGDTAVLEIDSLLLPASKGKWTNYLTGVLAGFLEQGLRPKGFDALIVSDVPIGAGLSSSAALEVSFATLLEAVTGKRLDPGAKALLCQSAEHRFAGVPCGIMDPFIATLGRADHALLLDCRSHEPQWVPFTDPTVTVLIINTNVKHELATSAYAQRRHECRAAAEALGLTSLRDASMQTLEEHADRLDSLLVRRARHVIGETSRTLQAAQCIRKREWNEFGRLLDASHQSLKEDYAVSCAELDAVVAIAHGIGQRGGVFGCRMTGGGFGGCAVALIETARKETIMQEIAVKYRGHTGRSASLFTSRPAGGAQVIEL